MSAPGFQNAVAETGELLPNLFSIFMGEEDVHDGAFE